MVKRIVLLSVLALLGCLSVFAADPAAAASVMPFNLNVSFYTASFKPVYTKPASVLGTPMVANKWCRFEGAISKDSLEYDGNGGSLKGFSAFRIQTKTKKSNSKVVIYIDNVKMTDAEGKNVYSVDFNDGENHGYYLAAGAPLSDMGKVVDFDGQKCFTLSALTKNVYNNVQIEVSWNIADLAGNPALKTVDLSDGKHVVSFDYYILVTE